MATLFKADASLSKYIEMIGFQKKHSDSKKQYYVNHKGNQIKIDEKSGKITFLNKYGNVVEKAHSFTSEQIENFYKREVH